MRMSGSSLLSEQGVAIAAAGGPLVVNIDGGTVSGGARLLHAYDAAGTPVTSINLTASSGGILTGAASAGPASVANINLQTGSQWTGAALNINNVAIDGASSWKIPADSQVGDTVTNLGLIAFTATLSVDSSAWMLQGGEDVAQSSVLRGDDRLHLGGMLGRPVSAEPVRVQAGPRRARPQGLDRLDQYRLPVRFAVLPRAGVRRFDAKYAW